MVTKKFRGCTQSKKIDIKNVDGGGAIIEGCINPGPSTRARGLISKDNTKLIETDFI